MPNYFIGLDLGQRADPTALAILEEPLWLPTDEDQPTAISGWVSPAEVQYLDRQRARPAPTRPTLALKHLIRYPLGTSYPAIVGSVAELLARPPLIGNAVLLVDATGCGRPVVDLFDQAKLNPLAITITGGNVVTQDGSEIHVPKRDLAMCLQVLMQNRRIAFAEALPLLEVLKKELQNFQVKISKLGHDTYENWRAGDHDDIVLAVCMAAWYREWSNPEDNYGFSYSYDQRGQTSGETISRRLASKLRSV